MTKETPGGLGAETEVLQRRGTALDAEIADLEAKLAIAKDQRARISTALDALDGPENPEGSADSSPDPLNHTGKYRPLWKWLIKNGAGRVQMSFAEVEQILGFALPPSSRRHLPHWYGYGGSAVARAIYDAGYKASLVNVEQESVVFVKRSPGQGG